jgi:putative Mg2+ transporter-C (MgtC) family protein
MPTSLSVHEIALRVILDVIAAGLIGMNRDERGRPAGLRTNILVSLAACVSMVQMNLLVNTNGKPSDSYVVMDIMRLPLGILSGIGFIGAGAILKRDDLVVGLTTAATLWYVTVMGLCFGSGQVWLGIAAFAIGFLVLAGFKKMEMAIPREHRGELSVTFAPAAQDREIEILLRSAGLRVTNRSLDLIPNEGGSRRVSWLLRWTGQREESDPPAIVRELEKQPGIERLQFEAKT